jgi:TctA family transporter
LTGTRWPDEVGQGKRWPPQLAFGPAEYFSLVVLGLIASVALASGSLVKALAMIVLGLLLGTVGQDLYSGAPRFTFGLRELYGGLNFVSLAVGCSEWRRSCATWRPVA